MLSFIFYEPLNDLLHSGQDSFSLLVKHLREGQGLDSYQNSNRKTKMIFKILSKQYSRGAGNLNDLWSQCRRPPANSRALVLSLGITGRSREFLRRMKYMGPQKVLERQAVISRHGKFQYLFTRYRCTCEPASYQVCKNTISLQKEMLHWIPFSWL